MGNQRCVRVDDDLWERLQQHASETGKTSSAIIRTLVKDYLDEEDVKRAKSEEQKRLANTNTPLEDLDFNLFDE